MSQNISTRSAHRERGEEPAQTTLEELPDNLSRRRELLMLVKRGGRGGKYNEDSANWEYFPKKLNRYMTRDYRHNHNKNVFTAINDVLEHEHNYKQESRQDDKAAYQLVNMASLENLLQKQMTCLCAPNTEVDSFIDFCCAQGNNQITYETMKQLKKDWHMSKKKKSRKPHISIQVQSIGTEPVITVRCKKCNKSKCVDNQISRYHGTNYNGTKGNNENCSWYTSNLNLVLGTLASGLGASDVSTFVSYLGLPNLQSFSRTQFHRIELLIGKFLRIVANESMQTALDLEVHNTLKNKGIKIKQWRTYLCAIALTVSYDMGWSKRSSGRRYDSLSGHAFLIGCLSRKIKMVQVTSKACSVYTSAEAKGIQPQVQSVP